MYACPCVCVLACVCKLYANHLTKSSHIRYTTRVNGCKMLRHFQTHALSLIVPCAFLRVKLSLGIILMATTFPLFSPCFASNNLSASYTLTLPLSRVLRNVSLPERTHTKNLVLRICIYLPTLYFVNWKGRIHTHIEPLATYYTQSLNDWIKDATTILYYLCEAFICVKSSECLSNQQNFHSVCMMRRLTVRIFLQDFWCCCVRVPHTYQIMPFICHIWCVCVCMWGKKVNKTVYEKRNTVMCVY